MHTYQTLAVVTLAGVLTAPAVFAQGNGNKDKQDARARRAAQAETRFRGMDKDGDGVITRAEWRGNEQAFLRHDTNHDNVLSGEEVRVAIRAEAPVQPPPPPPPPVRRPEDRDARFTRADRNNDGRIARDEWLGTAEAFRRMDTNNDSFVTRAEFQAVASSRTSASTAVGRTNTPGYRAGFDKGIVEGRQAGKEDKTINGGKWDLEGQRELEQADSGYDSRLGTREDYQAGYRAGFRRGYREGFGPR